MSAETTSATPPTDEDLDALEVARGLAKAGVPLFVAPPDPTHPAGFALPSRWQHTVPDPAAADKWRPGWALCAVMGQVVDGLDVDPRNGGEQTYSGLSSAGMWPRVHGRQRTPSGGWHDLVAPLRAGSRDGIRPGLDVKGGRPGPVEGAGRGFLFIAPTQRVSKETGEIGTYRWDVVPELEDVADDDSGAPLAEVVREAIRSGSPRAEAAGEPDHSGPIPDGKRHAVLVSYAGRLRNRGLSLAEAEQLMLTRWKDCVQPPQAQWPVTREEALQKLHDVYRRYPAGEEVPEVTTLRIVKPVEGEEAPSTPSTWASVDLAPYINGTYVAPQPTLLPRADGVCLLYPRLVHSLHGESESGKSWVAQCEAARLLLAGGRVLYVDFESDPASIVERLTLLGVPVPVVLERFQYRQPEVNPASVHELESWQDMLSQTYDLAVIDGVTDAMGLFGAKSVDNDEVAKWMRMFPKLLARRTGAAVVLIDHVTKDSETRGRFAIGGQAKMSGLDGAAYVVDVVEALGKGLKGVLTLRVAKDRPGSVRGHSGPMRKSDRTQESARFVLDSTGDVLAAHVDSWLDSRGEDGQFRPTNLMEKVSKFVEGHPGCSGRDIRAAITGRPKATLEAVERLVDEAFVTRVMGPRNGLLHTSVKPYREAEDARSERYVTPLEPSGSRGSDRFPSGSGNRSRDLNSSGSRGSLPMGTAEPLEGLVSAPEQLSGSGSQDRPESCHCGRSIGMHSAGQWFTCGTCNRPWHRFGPGGVPKCPPCSSGGEAA